jgi:hypothetical protein
MAVTFLFLLPDQWNPVIRGALHVQAHLLEVLQ